MVTFEAAVAAFLLRQYDAAAALLARAGAIAPEWSVAALGLANLRLHQGDFESARAALDPLLAAAPVLTPILVGDPLYRPLWELALPAAFQEALDALTLANPLVDSAGYYYHKGKLRIRQRRPVEARPYFDSLRVFQQRRLGDRTPAFDALIDLAAASIELGDRPAAIRYLDTLLVRDPMAEDAFRGSFALVEAARLLTRLGLHDRAIALLTRLLSLPTPASPGLLRADPAFAPLTREPGFQELLRGPP
jgi:tetratricopeptide (TPR) repeat protein